MNITTLQYFLVYATQQTQESTIKYVNWMVSYEFPSLSALASRMDGVGSRVHEDEMSMFVRRKDVLNVIKELELKTLEVAISNMRKRLEKHFKSEYDMV